MTDHILTITDKTGRQIRQVAPALLAKQIAGMVHGLCNMAKVQEYITYDEILEAAETLVAEMMEDKKCP